MRINKKVIAELDMVYAVNTIEINQKIHILAATEAQGKCLLFSPPDWKVSEVWGGPGGAMSLVPIKNRTSEFLAIQKFFPVFKSENACIVNASLQNTDSGYWNVEKLVDLPFVHRIETVEVQAEPYVIASTLSGAKSFTEDWSKPGAVYSGKIPCNSEERMKLDVVIEGITKNHGMHAAIMDGRKVILVSGSEGVFIIYVPEIKDNAWKYECIIKHEISDLCYFDIDMDGTPEIVTIEPFHGDILVIYQKIVGGWMPVFDKSISFGHALWSGEILGRPGVIVGSRGGEKKLELLYFASDMPFDVEEIVLDKGGGATQVTVVHEENRELVISANHAIGEIAIYELTAL